ncbi:protein LURP-one-related 11-like [Argentina anserina]|uniref:protein LURP-one-related 11-like n=1 Tax=Argentina anserina TaxID=57926 RepID=UPI002176638D|nr:protein LURP-one-related 11-like [Potentilla anserina]
MAKVHPLTVAPTEDASSSSTASCSNKYMTSKRETFTVWMKSLVMQGNGCTAFNESGEVVYRIDNYDDKHSNEVFLMDLRGKVLFTLCEQKLGLLKRWKGYAADEAKPMFRVRKSGRSILGNEESSSYKVTMGSDGSFYRLQSMEAGKSAALRITDSNGRVVAEAKRKQSSSGVVLGDDVLSLVVEADVDHSFIMALVTVYGLIKRQV